MMVVLIKHLLLVMAGLSWAVSAIAVVTAIAQTLQGLLWSVIPLCCCCPSWYASPPPSWPVTVLVAA